MLENFVHFTQLAVTRNSQSDISFWLSISEPNILRVRKGLWGQEFIKLQKIKSYCIPTTSGSFLSNFPDSNIPTLLVDCFCFSSTAAFGIPPFPYVPGPGTSLCERKSIQLVPSA